MNKIENDIKIKLFAHLNVNFYYFYTTMYIYYDPIHIVIQIKTHDKRIIVILYSW